METRFPVKPVVPTRLDAAGAIGHDLSRVLLARIEVSGQQEVPRAVDTGDHTNPYFCSTEGRLV
jgi:hypothetical protein